METLSQIPITLDRYRSKRILFVGVNWERKGGPELVKAFHRVLKTHKDAKLTIVGCTFPVKEACVEVAGPVPLDQVLGYLSQSSIYCMPTRMEPFGIAFLEALAAGLPVVALRLGAAPDFVINGKTGTLVEHGDAEGLAQALVSLLDDPEKCQEYGQNGRALVQETYNWDKVFGKVGNKILEMTRESKMG